jgi:HK97 family phage portal protein
MAGPLARYDAPGPLARFEAAVKAFRMTFSGGTSGSRGSLYGYPRFDNLTDPWPRTDYNRDTTYDLTAGAGRLHQNSAVAICLNFIATSFSEPLFQVTEADEEEDEKPKKRIPRHPMVKLIRRPNPFYGGKVLWTGAIVSTLTTGNGYWLKIRNRGGGIGQLWFESPGNMAPKSPEGGSSTFISHYERKVCGKTEEWAPEDVIHFRVGIDLDDHRLGRAPLQELIQEVATDNEAGLYTASILREMGVIGGILMNEDPEVQLDEVLADKIRRKFNELFRGTGRGGLMIPTFKAKYQELGATPEKMALDKINRVQEARIAAALQVPAMVVGLSVGENQQTYSNRREANAQFYQNCLTPLQSDFAETLQWSLLPDFDDPETREVGWDYRKVKALQEDANEQAKRVWSLYEKKIIKRSRALEMLGEQFDPKVDDVYFGEGEEEKQAQQAERMVNLVNAGASAPGAAKAVGFSEEVIADLMGGDLVQ